MKKKNNIPVQDYVLPEILNDDQLRIYGGYNLNFDYAYYNDKNVPAEVHKSPNSACFADLYWKDVSEYLRLKLRLSRKTSSSNILAFDDDFVNYYLTVLQDYFNFSFTVSSAGDTCTLDIVLHANRKKWVIKLFTTTLRYMFEETRPKTLLISLHLLKQNEENVNLLQLLSSVGALGGNNSGHGLSGGGRFYKYSKEKMQSMIYSTIGFSQIHSYANCDVRSIDVSNKNPEIVTLDVINEINQNLFKFYSKN